MQGKERKMNKVQHQLKYRFQQLAADKSGAGAVHKLYIYDEIRAVGPFNWDTWDFDESETSAKFFRDRLNEIPDGEEIELHVNSAGGEVGEGVTIYNLLREKSRAGSRIVGYVDGMAYSVAMDIVMACDEIHMGQGTSMFLHNPWTCAQGNAEQLRNIADQLDGLAAASLQLYVDRAQGKASEEDVKNMMDKETLLDPASCLAYGFCDVVDSFQTKDERADPEDPEDTDPEDPEDTDSEDPDATDPEDPEYTDNAAKQLKRLNTSNREVLKMLQSIKDRKEKTVNLKATLTAAIGRVGSK